jgi:hypothetical protein
MNSRRGTGRNGGEFLRTRTKDEKGHYERWPETRVHPELDTAVRAYLSDPACEYESMSDLIRGLVIEGLTRKRVSNPTTKSIIAIMKVWDEENRRMEMRRKFKQRIEETAREAYELVGEGRISEAAKHIHIVLMHVRDMAEDDPWRAECEKVLKEKFGYLLKMTQAASLLPRESEEAEWKRHEVM